MGFNLNLGDKTLLEVGLSLCTDKSAYVRSPQTLNLERDPDFCRNLFAATSNRRLTNVAQLCRKLKFFTTPDNENLELYQLLREGFQLRLIRWLHGKGHLLEHRGTIVPEDEHDQQQDDPLIRATALLRTVADTDLLPVEDCFKLTVGVLVFCVQSLG
jgi:hypothetical protein